MILGGSKTVNICQQIVKENLNSLEKEEIKLTQFIMAETLAFDPSEEYSDFCANYLVTCTKENFTDINGALGIVFCIDWRIAKGIFNKIIGRMREEKGSSRLRHFELFNTYILCVGRFGVLEARDGISSLLKGIDEGADEVSELIVNILVYCFIYPINLNILNDWVKESSLELAIKEHLYKLDKNTGYAIDKSVSLILNEIMNKSSLEENMESKNLKIYSNIATKILGSISIKRFNHEFYKLFKEMIAFMVNRPLEEGDDELIISQMKASEYPQNIYDELVSQLISLKGSTPSSMRKKLRYLEGIVINKSFVSDRVNIPDIFSTLPEKQIGIEHIVAISNIARIMKEGELTSEVQKLLSSKTNQPQNLNYLMVYLLAAGNREFEWREQLLNKIIGFKKNKIVKEFVSYWWRGRTPESEQEQRLYTLVRIVENPYSYFA